MTSSVLVASVLLILHDTIASALFAWPSKTLESVAPLTNMEDSPVPFGRTKRSDITATEWDGKGDDYLNRHYFHLKQSVSYDVSYNMEDCSDYTLCDRRRYHVREYKMEDVVRCLDSLSTKRNHRPIHIAFIGDSTVRQHFLSFIQWIPDYDRMIVRNSTKAAVYAFHEDRNLTSKLMDNLVISFRWRPFLEQDLIDDFTHWASISNGNQVPDFILLGVTAHPISKTHNILDLEKYETILRNELLPLINRSLTFHVHQEIVWLSQSRTTETFKSGKVYSHLVNKYNDNIRHIFKNTRVVIWDAINALVEEYIRACSLYQFKRRDKSLYTNCNDFIHPGFNALFLGTSLIINHICESV